MAIRSENINLNLVAITELFNLLEIYANLKNPNAAIIYKILVFFLVENHDNHSLREYLLLNFK